MKRLILLLLLILSACRNLERNSKVEKTTIFYTSDVFGRVNQDYFESIGYSVIYELINNERKVNKYTYYIDGGNSFFGSNFVSLSRGHNLVPIYNMLELDFLTLGNHDFSFGFQNTLEIDKSLGKKVILSNIYFTQGGYVYKPYEIIELDRGKIGIFALISPNFMKKNRIEYFEDLIIVNPVNEAKKIMEKFEEEKVEFVILLSHLSLDKFGEKEETLREVLEEVKGINLVLDSNNSLETNNFFIGKSEVIRNSSYGKSLVRIDITFNKSLKRIEKKFYDVYNIHKEVGKNEDIDLYIQNVNEILEVYTNKIIGETKFFLNGAKEFVTSNESSLGNFIVDSIKKETRADIVFVNGGSINKSINAGFIRKSDILEALPFTDKILILKLKGNEILYLLEKSFSIYPKPFDGFLQLSGLKVYIDPLNKPGERVVEVRLDNGEKLSESKEYLVAVTDFLKNGGDGYYILREKEVVEEFKDMREIIIKYLDYINEKKEKRIEIIK